MPRLEDALDVVGAEGAVDGGVGESLVERLGREALSQREHTPGDVSPPSWRADRQLAEEVVAALTDSLEGCRECVEVED